ncbi:MAG: hypothetical protein HUU19_02530 [Phycisphaerales bacterium]|nr:hypothetical protein [Phycisphaerales bacterium]
MLSQASSRWGEAGAIVCVALAAASAGCTNGDPDFDIRADVARGDYSRAESKLRDYVGANDKRPLEYLLDRSRLGIVTLADGRPDAAEPWLAESFATLRRQGLNENRQVGAAVLGESGQLFWKGEPFEQALTLHYTALCYAMLNQWDNARAAANASLFQLRSYAQGDQSLSKAELAQRAATQDEAWLDKGYANVKTDFALGYFVAGVANFALGRSDPDRANEARDFFREAFTLRPDLRPIAEAIVDGRANTVVFVDAGSGPSKQRYGDDGVLTRFAGGGGAVGSLAISVNNAPSNAALACDVQTMASDHRWNNLEDVRQFKSLLGTGLIAGGVIVAGTSDNRSSEGRRNAQLATGLAMVLAGLAVKATAQADIRHCEVMPASILVGATTIDGSATLGIHGPGLDMVLPGVLGPSAAEPLRVVYVRVPAQPVPAWASSGRVVYATDSLATRVPGDDLPYILGGRCCRTPSAETLRLYQASGNLTNLSLMDLQNLYTDEGITWRAGDEIDGPKRHILNAGTSLVAPVAGSTGFARLVGQEHPPYQPKSARVKELAAFYAARATTMSANPTNTITPTEKKP